MESKRNKIIERCIDCKTPIPFEDLYCVSCIKDHPETTCDCPNRCNTEEYKEGRRKYLREYARKNSKKNKLKRLKNRIKKLQEKAEQLEKV